VGDAVLAQDAVEHLQGQLVHPCRVSPRFGLNGSVSRRAGRDRRGLDRPT
jgi:hypothetical protein